MRNLIALVPILLSMCPAVLSQSKPGPTPKPTPNFAGTWKFEKAESPNMGFNDQLKKLNKTGSAEKTEITQTETTILMKVTGSDKGSVYSFERTYFVDGRGETNAIQSDPNSIVSSKTTMKKKALIIDALVTDKGTRKKQVGHFTEEWNVASDGQRLRVTTCFGVGSDLCTTYTYRRE
jgi:hypothetical protein